VLAGQPHRRGRRPGDPDAAHRAGAPHDFIIAADECYAEIYLDEQRTAGGSAAGRAAMGRDDFRRCVVFHSLSKRSNAPGLRSGFVAGDAEIIERFFAYRTYHGCAMPLPHQHASGRLGDEAACRSRTAACTARSSTRCSTILDGVLDVQRPAAGFYLWPRTPIDDTEFARACSPSSTSPCCPAATCRAGRRRRHG
jgi:N-succinyldiaminopimelate aminotransferase